MIPVNVQHRPIEHGDHMFKIVIDEIAASDDEIDIGMSFFKTFCVHSLIFNVAERKDLHRDWVHAA